MRYWRIFLCQIYFKKLYALGIALLLYIKCKWYLMKKIYFDEIQHIFSLKNWWINFFPWPHFSKKTKFMKNEEIFSMVKIDFSPKFFLIEFHPKKFIKKMWTTFWPDSWNYTIKNKKYIWWRKFVEKIYEKIWFCRKYVHQIKTIWNLMEKSAL